MGTHTQGRPVTTAYPAVAAALLSLLFGTACSRSHGPPNSIDASLVEAPKGDAAWAADATTDARANAPREPGADAAAHACGSESRLDFADACDAPPQAKCIDDVTLQQPPRRGSCVAHQCDYELQAHRHPCFGGCSDDGCRICPGEAPVRELSTFPLGTIERRC